MAKFKYLKHIPGDPDYVFECPGCECHHGIWTSGRNQNKAIWQFNGDLNKPTVSPSIRVRFHHKEKGNIVCHSFIKNGVIEFCKDSTHALAGKTVELKEI
jgi:hypothetical protein